MRMKMFLQSKPTGTKNIATRNVSFPHSQNALAAGAVPDPAEEAHSAPPDLLAGLGEGKRKEGRGKAGKRKEGKNPKTKSLWLWPCL